jgi:hypothetical protein
MTRVSRRTFLLACGASLAPLAWAQGADEAFTGLPGTRVLFAPVETGRALLMADDDYVVATSEFQRRAVMQSASPVTLEAFRQWNGDAVRSWPADQRERWLKALGSLAPGFAKLRIPLPAEVMLVASSGQEMANAPYTRGNAIVIPLGATFRGYSDATLLAHELWHVASRHAPALAERLYAEIGFEPIAELSFPPQWAGRRIANPDAPRNRHAMRLAINGREALVTPVLVATRTMLNPGETIFSVLEPRLLEVEPHPDGRTSRAVMRNDALVWHLLNAKHDYLRRLGGNTHYVIHPEETIADNVAFLASGVTPRNVELLARIRAVLEAAR